MKNLLTLDENSDICCNDEMKPNCICEECETINMDNNIRDSICMPLRLNRITNYTEVSKHDVGINNIVTFIINNNDMNYSLRDKICITNIGLNYDYIGLPYNFVTSNRSYVDGELIDFIPENLYNTRTIENPYYLFNDMSKIISLSTGCKCKNKLDNCYHLMRINESQKYFQVFNMSISASGYIGCSKFSATGNILDKSTGNENTVQLINLNIISSINYDASLCVPNVNCYVNVIEKFQPKLKVDCIRPIQGSIVNDGFITRFNAKVDFSFDVSKKIYFYEKQCINVYSVRNTGL